MQQVLENGVVTVPTANPICSRKLARKAIDQMKQMDRAREIHGKFGNQKDVVSSCRANRIGADPKVGIGRRLARLGCASLVAVVKPANLRYGNDGAAFWRVNGPRCRRVLGQREVRPGFVIIRQE